MAGNQKRITLKRTRPNPLFQDWLEELHEEAKQKKSKLKYMLKEALNSLSKYPLPLQSGEECAILKGFNTKLCSFLDKRLEEYESSNKCKNNPSAKSKLDTGLSKKLVTDIINECTENDIHSQTPQEDLQEKETTKTTRTVSCESIDLCQHQDEPEMPVQCDDVIIEVVDLEHVHQTGQMDLNNFESSVEELSQTPQEDLQEKETTKTTRTVSCESIDLCQHQDEPEMPIQCDDVIIEVVDLEHVHQTGQMDLNNFESSVEELSQTPQEDLQEKETTKTTRSVSCESIDLCQHQDEPEMPVQCEDVIIEVVDLECVHQTGQMDLNNFESSVEELSQTARKSKPTYKSASDAILMALLEHINLNSESSITKDDLLQLAHKYSEDYMKTPTEDSLHYLWSYVGKMITKNLLIRCDTYEPRFKLTDSGHATALELFEGTKLKQQLDEITSSGISHENNTESEINILTDSNVINTAINNVEEDIVFEAFSFDIILLIDMKEINGLSKMHYPTMIQIKKYPKLRHEYRSLSVGDFTWIARHKTTKQELVLPYIIERKRMDDLAASIKDGRFHEQKFRLKKCCSNVIYMVEKYKTNKNLGLPMSTLMQGLANTRVQDGFKVHMTKSLEGSVQFLAILTMRLINEYQDTILKGHNKKEEGNMLMTYDFFRKYFIKNKPLSIKYTFIKMLLQLKGLSVERALAITNKYQTPKLLIEAYENCEQKEGEMLLAHLRCENNRTVGPAISKTVYQLFTRMELS